MPEKAFASRILIIKSLNFFEADLNLNLGPDKIRIPHALIVVGTNVGSSQYADVFSTFFVKIR